MREDLQYIVLYSENGNTHLHAVLACKTLYTVTLHPAQKMGKISQIIEYSIRIALCVVVARLYEFHWLSKDHILGYLWVLNHFKAKGDEVEELWERMVTKDYTPNRAIFLNAYVGLTLLFVGKKK